MPDWLVAFLCVAFLGTLTLSVAQCSQSGRTGIREGSFLESWPVWFFTVFFGALAVGLLVSIFQNIGYFLSVVLGLAAFLLLLVLPVIVIDKASKGKQTYSSRLSRDNVQEQPQRSTEPVTHPNALSASGENRPDAAPLLLTEVKPTPESMPYIDETRYLAMILSRRIPMPEWATGIPNGYTPKETQSIERVRRAILSDTDPSKAEAVKESFDYLIAELGLIRLARQLQRSIYDNWIRPERPDDWGSVLSANLKAWLCDLNPFILLDVADILLQVGQPAEASMAVSAAEKFPTYARTTTHTPSDVIALELIREEFPPGRQRKAHEGTIGIYSLESIRLLGDEIAGIRHKLG